MKSPPFSSHPSYGDASSSMCQWDGDPVDCSRLSAIMRYAGFDRNGNPNFEIIAGRDTGITRYTIVREWVPGSRNNSRVTETDENGKVTNAPGLWSEPAAISGHWQITGFYGLEFLSHAPQSTTKNPCDETLRKTFGNKFTVAAGNGEEPVDLPDRAKRNRGGNVAGRPQEWPHLFGYSAHFYAFSDTKKLGFAHGDIYVPDRFTAHGAFTSDGHWFYYPKLGNQTNVTLLVMHIQNFGIRRGVRNEAGSVLIGQTSNGGGAPGYIHSHLELHRGRGIPNASFKEFPDDLARSRENQRLRNQSRVFFPRAFCN